MLPGSNCDHDVYHVLKHILGQDVVFLWHEEEDLRGSELVVLPGGFAYGDYLRAGALAALAPVMDGIRRHAAAGGLVLGICNGFQVLLEAGLLPGAMLRNRGLRFLCRDVYLKVERNDLPFTHRYGAGQVIRLPIAHAEGNFTAPAEVLDRLEAGRQVVFRYVDSAGRLDDAANPNGSARAIAGIANPEGNVLGLMPHPERAADALLGCRDGLPLFEAVLEAARAGLEVAR
jgi:phosphoribosylformylglycinamidine synthase